ncbi:TetR/AcrR family transcriptional regulator [Streptomyces purpurogeneiscleroticus]|uniref:TetR/AcrR family transcriptional regulator n=1 Tax=Streptomyces purpurogeneiscleroticus TaxID=68259 RepID=UPI001CBB331B|nr:TetR/AcrR family transcriptional regulator [Streptomyces purpurogeneiscleroticus]MBZ4017221.1 TetR family transcriptional regulator [Streptomyces purpurogeneiscleroticus]
MANKEETSGRQPSGRGHRPWATRTARDRSDTPVRHRLLDAAEAVFTRLGYGPATIADIAAEAELSRAGFYVYFASKEEIFQVLAVRVRDAFLAAQEVPDTDPDDVRAVAHDSTAAFLAAYAAHLPLLRLIEQQAQGDDGLRELWEEINRRPTRRTARYIRRLTEAGELAPVADPLAVAHAVGGMSVRFAQLVAADPDAYEAAVRDVTAMYLHLLRPYHPEGHQAIPEE